MRATTFASALLAGVSLCSMGAAASAQDAGASAGASSPTAAAADSAKAVQEIVVTGSRIVRNGYTAPTPVTVVPTEQLQRQAPSNLPDALNQLPQFANSRSQNQSGQAVATSPQAGNYLNLRGLGSVRGLILLDGQRLPPTSFEGTVDTNIIPQLLIQRVDVVTGGASAAYGSDAVSGVVNFILDTRFTGLKGTMQGGISTYNDDRSWRGGVAAGAKLFGGRGHLLVSAEHYQSDGIPDQGDRPRGDELWLAAGNGTAALPYRNFRDTHFISGTFGGVIINGGPLSRYHFLPGSPGVTGPLVPFNPGTPTGQSNVSYGGDGSEIVGHTLTGSLRTDQLFTRFDYDLTPTISGFAQVTFAEARNVYNTVGSGTQLGDITMYPENPYLPDSARQSLLAAGVTSFTMGRISRDLPYKVVNTLNDVGTLLAGLKGKVGGFDWRLNYSHGESRLRLKHFGNLENRKWYAALDAVRGPAGNVVCRITVTNPGLQDDCIPINIFGENAPTAQAAAYVMGVSQYQVVQRMDDAAATVSGDLFSLPAGPVSVAIGGEYRKQKLDEDTNADPSTPTSSFGLRNAPVYMNRFASTNVGQAHGSYDIKEAFGEIAVPILKDQPLAQSLELNGAARHTDYSTSGGVNTWKIGATYNPVEDIRFRVTRSRDIRAPTLYELYAGAQAGRGPVNDPHTGLFTNAVSISRGNPDLKPEIGDTLTIGAVWQPTFFRGFSASVDFYDIKIKDAISSTNAADELNDCEVSNGASPFCALIARPLPFSDRSPANFPSSVTTVQFNQAALKMRGVDFDASYTTPLSRIFSKSDAMLNVRLIGGYLDTYTTQANTAARVVEQAGAQPYPKWRANISINYQDGPLSVNLQERYIGKVNRTRDPTIFYVDNDIPAVIYTDATVEYKFNAQGHEFVGFVTVNNLLNKLPPLVPPTGQPGLGFPTVQALYDIVGRYFTAGVRFRY